MTSSEQPLDAKSNQPGIDKEGLSWVATEVVDYFGGRTASREAAFFIPYLKPNMVVLDCGCGPGAITADLGNIVTSGQVIGIDREAAQLENARRYAQQRAVSNVEFRTANIYEIPYPDSSFDAVLAHAVLQHLSEPMVALREMHRVLKPGGIIGVREEDRDADLLYPFPPILQEAHALTMRLWQQVGGNPYFPKRYRSVLREAGFMRIQMTASCEYRSNLETTRAWAHAIAHFLQDPHLVNLAVELGWADHTTLSEMVAAYKAWGEHRDAFWCETWCAAVGWKE
ncbi:MAG: class I SAM-dependent methyltransferase [Chloroflexi bacterium]|nr:class I SAM-dependent methyltransferase [Chloroflexota bacterium]